MKGDIKVLQTSALSRINFCFLELKRNPPLSWENKVLDRNSIENSKDNYKNLNEDDQKRFRTELFSYLKGESTTEARIMLIINYLAALLVKGKNNNISIHKNFSSEKDEIEAFEEENRTIIENIKIARDKLYAHIDLNWQDYAKSISFEEFGVCLSFLNKLFNYDFDQIMHYESF